MPRIDQPSSSGHRSAHDADRGSGVLTVCFVLLFPIRLLLRCRLSSLSQVPFSPPGVDCDVGNLAIDKRGLMLKKTGMVSVVPLLACVAHAQTKEFVFFYDLSGDARKMEFDRLTKYLGRGWVRRRRDTNQPNLVSRQVWHGMLVISARALPPP